MPFQKDVFEACMRLAEFSAGRHDQRRDVEWKVTLGFWAAPLAAMVGQYSIPKEPGIQFVVGCILLILVIIFVYWQKSIADGNEEHKSRSWHYKDEAEKYLLANGDYTINEWKPAARRAAAFLTVPHVVQIAVTATLFLLFWFAKASRWAI